MSQLSLFKLVNEEGGFDAVCKDRRWTKISIKMGFAPGKAVGSHLRAHYERILYPYNLFQTGDNLPVGSSSTRVFVLTVQQDCFHLSQCLPRRLSVV